MQRPVAVLGAVALQAAPLAFLAGQGLPLGFLAAWVVGLGALCAGLLLRSTAAWWAGLGLGLLIAFTAQGRLPYFRLSAAVYGLALAGCLYAARRWFQQEPTAVQ